jgi:CRISPR-associated protein Cmr4
MYHKAYGIIETKAPLHVGASAGEESGNLNLIFRDQFTQTGIIPGSSIRGRFRADMRLQDERLAHLWYGHSAETDEDESDNKKDLTTEALVKFEYASLVWFPVYCPGQPIVRISCPRLLNRYQKIRGLPKTEFQPYSYYQPNKEGKKRDRLFFNLGVLPLKNELKKEQIQAYLPSEVEDIEEHLLLIVKDTEISMIHDMALYRQSRAALESNIKKVKNFFNLEALPEMSILIFPIALKQSTDPAHSWEKFIQDGEFESTKELYLGGLESIGLGRTNITVKTCNK